MKRLLNERFSCTMKTTCAIGDCAVACAEAKEREDGAAPIVQPASAATAAARTASRELVISQDVFRPLGHRSVAFELQPVCRGFGSGNRLELPWFLMVIESIARGILGSPVAAMKLRQAEVVLDKTQHARGLVSNVRYVSGFGVRRDYEQRHAEAEPVVINEGWFDRIEPSAPVVPKDENGGGIPERTLSDGIDDARDPGGTLTCAQS